MKNIFRYKKTIVLLVVIVVAVFLYSNNTNGEITLTLEKEEHTDSILISGRVEAVQKAKLSFKRSGEVIAIHKTSGGEVKEGEAIVELGVDRLLREERELQSTLAEEIVRLNSINSGSRRGDLRVAALNLETAKTNLKNISNEVLSRSESILNSLQQSVYSDLDQLFSNPNSDFPRFSVNLGVIDSQTVENARIEIGNILDEVAELPVPETVNEVLSTIERYKDILVYINVRVRPWAKILRDTEEDTAIELFDSFQSQLLENIEEIVNNISKLNTSILELKQAEEKYSNTYVSISNEELITQEARVNAVRNKLAQVQIDIEDSKLVAPFDGIIGSIEADLGEILSPETTVVQIITDDKFEVIADVSELNIGRVNQQQKVLGIIDALNIETPLKIKSVSPVEKLVQNIITYEVILEFVNPSNQIRSGLSVDVEFITEEYGEFIGVPKQAISIDDEGDMYVNVKKDRSIEKRKVSSGVITSSGLIEIKGVSEGETIVFSK